MGSRSAPEEGRMASVRTPVEVEETIDDPEIVWVSPEDGRRIFDEAAWEWLGIRARSS